MPVFSARDARAAGIGAGTLLRYELAGVLRQPARGWYAIGDVSGLAVRARELVPVIPPGAALCRCSAAAVHGVSVLPPGADAAAWPVEIIVPVGRVPLRRPGIVSYVSRLLPNEIGLVDGVPVTAPVRTALDCGRYLPGLAAVAALDAFLATGRVDVKQLTAAAAQLAGQRNAAVLRQRIGMSDGRAESPGETWTRVRLLEAGLPVPEPQIALSVPGFGRVRLDMGYRRHKVGIEYDGEDHHTESEDRLHDEQRRTAVEATGWTLVVVRKHDVLNDRAAIGWTEQVAGLLFAAGWEPADAELDRLTAGLARMRTKLATSRRVA